ncbi:hypothetical protein [Roseibacillus ishigakijimensis]|uniref:Uncharacterized protein n=1 Tax=Roseibacillus ishigakijimensis TaxID=454146 RepID=A0A934RPA1_9BACT|nr:hypothetical protein [Roseibacillus ishigakijimensis]MBK1835492.1 hypothetical protein [Roseibacillus ishigakijimensis]
MPLSLSPATLARGQSADLRPLFAEGVMRQALPRTLAFVILGSGSYGFTVGLWRGWEMAGYVALKTPLLLLATLLVTGLLNGILGLLLGTGIGLRQSLLCQLLAFSLAAIVLAALAPVTFFLALEAPPADSSQAAMAHSTYLLTHTLLIALAGFLAVVRLFSLLRTLTPDFQAARLTLLSWLASNAFVGAQLSYLFRPFFGSPGLEVAFLRPDPFNGTFYEAVWHALTRLFPSSIALLILFLFLCGAALILQKILQQPQTTTKKS